MIYFFIFLENIPLLTRMTQNWTKEITTNMKMTKISKIKYKYKGYYQWLRMYHKFWNIYGMWYRGSKLCSHVVFNLRMEWPPPRNQLQVVVKPSIKTMWNTFSRRLFKFNGKIAMIALIIQRFNPKRVGGSLIQFKFQYAQADEVLNWNSLGSWYFVYIGVNLLQIGSEYSHMWGGTIECTQYHNIIEIYNNVFWDW